MKLRHKKLALIGGALALLGIAWPMVQLHALQKPQAATTQTHAGVPSIPELTLTLRELAAKIAAHGTFNFLLSNGQALWAHASTGLYYVERHHPFTHATLSDEDLSINFAEHTQPSDRVAGAPP